MKKSLLLCLIAAVSIPSFAQNNIAVGPVAGFGHAWLSGGEGNNKYKASGNFGLQLYYSPTDHIGIGAGLGYSIEGGKREIGATTYTARLNYLRLPIQAIYFFGDFGDRVRPKIGFGPSIGFLLGGKQSIGSGETGVGDDYKSIDVGMIANGGIHYRLVSGIWLTMDMNYYFGLADITEAAVKNKNHNIGFNAGLAFGVGRR